MDDNTQWSTRKNESKSRAYKNVACHDFFFFLFFVINASLI